MNIFNALTTPESLWVVLFLFVSFLIGFITAWLMRGKTVRRLREQVKKYEIDLEALNREHNDLKEKYGILEADVKRLQLELDDQKDKRHRLEAEKGQLFADLYGAKASIEELENNYAFANQKLGESQVEYEKANAQLNEAEAEKSQLKSEIEALKAGAGVVAATSGDDDERVTKLEADLAEAQNKNAALRKELDGLNVEKGQLTAALKAAQATVAAANTEEVETRDVELSPEEKATTAASALGLLFGTSLPAAGAEDQDDLKIINGIGPFLEKKLNDVGIYTFDQVSKLDDKAIDLVTEAIQFFPGRIKRDDWVGQAKDILSNR